MFDRELFDSFSLHCNVDVLMAMRECNTIGVEIFGKDERVKCFFKTGRVSFVIMGEVRFWYCSFVAASLKIMPTFTIVMVNVGEIEMTEMLLITLNILLSCYLPVTVNPVIYI